MVFVVEWASTGLHGRHTMALPLLYRHSMGATVQNRSLTGKSPGYVGSPPWHTVAKSGVTVIPQLDTAHRFAMVLPGGLTVERRVMPE